MNTQHQAAQAFASQWKGRGYEKGENPVYWMELLQVLGIGTPGEWISLDDKVMQAYGFRISLDFTEQDCVAALMRLYQELTTQ